MQRREEPFHRPYVSFKIGPYILKIKDTNYLLYLLMEKVKKYIFKNNKKMKMDKWESQLQEKKKRMCRSLLPFLKSLHTLKIIEVM